VVGNKIVVVGGRIAGTSPAEVIPTEIFDGTSWHDAAGIPVPGDHLAAASDGTYLYAVGGRRLEVTSNTAAVQRFDPAANRWIELKNAPGKVSDAGAAIIGGRLIVVGGEGIGAVTCGVITAVMCPACLRVAGGAQAERCEEPAQGACRADGRDARLSRGRGGSPGSRRGRRT
jgi:Kelch motif